MITIDYAVNKNYMFYNNIIKFVNNILNIVNNKLTFNIYYCILFINFEFNILDNTQF